MSPTIGAQELRMRGLLLRIIINASAILVASRIISGIQVDNTLTLLGAGLTLGLINATVHPNPSYPDIFLNACDTRTIYIYS